jgi:hypothetical protein
MPAKLGPDEARNAASRIHDLSACRVTFVLKRPPDPAHESR